VRPPGQNKLDRKGFATVALGSLTYFGLADKGQVKPALKRLRANQKPLKIKAPRK
jgi:hypothetical protein